MKKIAILIALFAITTSANAQVPKKVIVEHFTNSKCGICASRNPGFYTNLAAQTNVLHLAVHPSSPYNTCAFNVHNPIQNDARTNFYGVFGGTPQLVIQGTPLSTSANYASATIFANYIGQTSPWKITVSQTVHQTDSITATIVVKKVAAVSNLPAKLFVALAEDTVFFASPNGEAQHYDVFRKSMTTTDGLSIQLPASVGDSVSKTFTVTASSVWNINRMFALAILQDSASKQVWQTERYTKPTVVVFPTSVQNIKSTSNYTLVKQGNAHYITGLSNKEYQASVFTIAGQKVASQTLSGNNNVVKEPNQTGIYILQVTENGKQIFASKIIVQ